MINGMPWLHSPVEWVGETTDLHLISRLTLHEKEKEIFSCSNEMIEALAKPIGSRFVPDCGSFNFRSVTPPLP
jgi:hypothetical protein